MSAAAQPVRYTIGVDIGGTFTDCVAICDDGRVVHAKSPSTHPTSPVEGLVAGVTLLAAAEGKTLAELLSQTTQFSHGTTIGTNLVVERKGAKVGLIATRGHGDAILMMRGRGRSAGATPDALMNFRDTDKPAPLVPRHRIVEVSERITADGSVFVTLDDASARAAVQQLLEQQVDAIAIALLWSFRNPVHERRLRDIVRELAPSMFVSLSSETSPRQGEFERSVSAVINSYVGPASSRYLSDLEQVLAGHGLARPPLIMQSNGGVLPVALAKTRPIQTIGSGPAGGLAGTAAIARRCGHRDVIATDMGGTSFEVGLLRAGLPLLASENVIEQHTYKVPHLDTRSIACGGGSIARVDPRSGALTVGPESAGSDPGPACYGRGTLPTVTDADVVLGLVNPDRFRTGRTGLSRDRAVAAVRSIADQTGLSLERAASGILRVNGYSAATLIRQRTIEQGLDPRDFVLYAFGGAGPVHAFMFAAELGIGEVVIPLGNGASTLSAYGIAASDVTQVFERECAIREPVDMAALAEVMQSVEDTAMAEFAAAGFDRANLRLDRSLLTRYAEQYNQELPLAWLNGRFGAGDADRIAALFRAEYTSHYGAAALSQFHRMEIFGVRIAASIALAAADTAHEPAPAAEPETTDMVFWPGSDGWIETAVHHGAPPVGTEVHGPAVIQLAHTTIPVPPGGHLRSDTAGNCILHLEASPP